MPSRNIVRNDAADSYYHVYARGHGKIDIFRDDEDYRVFLNLFKRYLCDSEQKDHSGRAYVSLRGSIELNCYCIMPNHFHLIFYQVDLGTMSKIMHNVTIGYGRYFNDKYNLSGKIFESTYKASIITTESYMLHISRYIHLNPKKWRTYDYSSLPYFLNVSSPDWIMPHRILDMFISVNEYMDFLSDYEGYRRSLKEIKFDLANS